MMIAFVGVLGSGKTHQQNLLVQQGYVPLDFKDGLIDMAEDLVGYPIRADYDKFKELVIGLNRPADGNKCTEKISLVNKECLEYFPEAMTGRRLLQRLGTEVMRKRNPNYWVDQFIIKAKSLLLADKDVVCADARFENELAAIKSLCLELNIALKIVFCDYRSDRYSTDAMHPSEALAQRLLAEGCKDMEDITARI